MLHVHRGEANIAEEAAAADAARELSLIAAQLSELDVVRGELRTLAPGCMTAHGRDKAPKSRNFNGEPMQITGFPANLPLAAYSAKGRLRMTAVASKSEQPACDNNKKNGATTIVNTATHMLEQ